MVVFYDLKTKEITRTEDNTLEPILPLGENEGYFVLEEEIGSKVLDYSFTKIKRLNIDK